MKTIIMMILLFGLQAHAAGNDHSSEVERIQYELIIKEVLKQNLSQDEIERLKEELKEIKKHQSPTYVGAFALEIAPVLCLNSNHEC